MFKPPDILCAVNHLGCQNEILQHFQIHLCIKLWNYSGHDNKFMVESSRCWLNWCEYYAVLFAGHRKIKKWYGSWNAWCWFLLWSMFGGHTMCRISYCWCWRWQFGLLNQLLLQTSGTQSLFLSAVFMDLSCALWQVLLCKFDYVIIIISVHVLVFKNILKWILKPAWLMLVTVST